jgi:hypothetical protein
VEQLQELAKRLAKVKDVMLKGLWYWTYSGQILLHKMENLISYTVGYNDFNNMINQNCRILS